MQRRQLILVEKRRKLSFGSGLRIGKQWVSECYRKYRLCHNPVT
jgi:hypothetical protein